MTTTTATRCGGLVAALAALALAAPAGAPAATLLSGTSTTLQETTSSLDLSTWITLDSDSDTSTKDGTTASAADGTASSKEAAAEAGCSDAPLSQRFSAWSDPADYKLVPGGDFEDGGAGWLLTGGAAVVSGGNVHGTGGRSLHLPAGASATSPPVCIAPGSPVARGFAVGTGAGLAVELLDEAGKGKPAGKLTPTGAWDATRRFSLSQGHYLQGGKSDAAWLRMRFTADAGSSWRVDDVYVDPKSFG